MLYSLSEEVALTAFTEPLETAGYTGTVGVGEGDKTSDGNGVSNKAVVTSELSVF